MWKKKPEAPTLRPPLVRGHFDGVIGRRAIGWLAEPLTASDAAVVEILLDGAVIAEGKAGIFRHDILDVGIGNGQNGFDITLPEAIFDGQTRQVFARSKRHGLFLQGNPKTINPPLASSGDALRLQESLANSIQAMEVRLTQLESAIQSQHALLQAIHRAVGPGETITSSKQDRGEFFDQCHEWKHDRGDIIFFSIIDWSFRIQRPQHLASRLAKMGYRVLYVSVHLAPWPRNWDARFEICDNPAPGVFEVRLRLPGALPSVYAGFTDPRQLKEAILAVDELTCALDLVRPHAIIQFPSWHPVAHSIPGAQIVYDCLDHMAGFSNVSREIAALEEQLVSNSDIVVTSSAYLQDHVEKTRGAAIVRNGCEFEYFSRQPQDLLLRGKRPVVGYYGAIAEWFDTELVTRLAREHPEWDFVLIGATAGSDVSELESLTNVTLTGEKPYKDLTKYLYGFSVCIIPFKVVELIKATNPVKLYEYLAAGKPVVCTDMPEARLAPAGLVHVTQTYEEFERAIASSIDERDDRIVRRRRSWAAENSWDSRANQYDHLLQSSTARVSVIVLTYNGLSFNQACLKSLTEFSDYPNLEIICVDNNSTDGTREYLKEWGEANPSHRVILNDDNLGFAGGNNVGMEAATGDVIVLLNNDTYVTRGWVQDLVRPLLLDKTIGLAGPVTNMIGGVQKISLHYRDMTEMAERARGFTMLRKEQHFETDAVAFFCVAMRREVMKEVGLLDPAFGLGYFEDDDYCRRIMKAGYRIVCVDGVFVHHHLSASFSELEHGAKGELFKKNRAIFEEKWGPWKPHTYRVAQGFGE